MFSIFSVYFNPINVFQCIHFIHLVDICGFSVSFLSTRSTNSALIFFHDLPSFSQFSQVIPSRCFNSPASARFPSSAVPVMTLFSPSRFSQLTSTRMCSSFVLCRRSPFPNTSGSLLKHQFTNTWTFLNVKVAHSRKSYTLYIRIENHHVIYVRLIFFELLQASIHIRP